METGKVETADSPTGAGGVAPTSEEARGGRVRDGRRLPGLRKRENLGGGG